jgi:phosphatidate cytidylyltransferase
VASRDPALPLRLVSALALVPIVLGMLILGVWPFAVLLALAVVLMALEWRRLIGIRFGRRSGLLAGGAALVSGLLALVLGALGRPDEALMVLAAGALGASGAAWWLGAPPVLTGFGVIYLGIPVLALIWLRSLEGGVGLMIWLLVVVWATDIMAYVVGRTVGGPRLAPTISPGKTWSGLWGGVLGAALAGGLAAALGGAGRPAQAAGLGALLAVIGQIGDLVESTFKRRAGVKDSGHVIPGHGGVLDRLDSLLFAAPALALVLLLVGPEARPWP